MSCRSQRLPPHFRIIDPVENTAACPAAPQAAIAGSPAGVGSRCSATRAAPSPSTISWLRADKLARRTGDRRMQSLAASRIAASPTWLLVRRDSESSHRQRPALAGRFLVVGNADDQARQAQAQCAPRSSRHRRRSRGRPVPSGPRDAVAGRADACADASAAWPSSAPDADCWRRRRRRPPGPRIAGRDSAASAIPVRFCGSDPPKKTSTRRTSPVAPGCTRAAILAGTRLAATRSAVPGPADIPLEAGAR